MVKPVVRFWEQQIVRQVEGGRVVVQQAAVNVKRLDEVLGLRRQILGNLLAAPSRSNSHPVHDVLRSERDTQCPIWDVRRVRVREHGYRIRQHHPDSVLRHQHTLTVHEDPAAFRGIGDLVEICLDVGSFGDRIGGAAAQLHSAGRDAPCNTRRIGNLGTVKDRRDPCARELFGGVVRRQKRLRQPVQVVHAEHGDRVGATQRKVVFVVDNEADEQQLCVVGRVIPSEPDQSARGKARDIGDVVVVRAVLVERVEQAVGSSVVQNEAHGAGRERVVDVLASTVDVDGQDTVRDRRIGGGAVQYARSVKGATVGRVQPHGVWAKPDVYLEVKDACVGDCCGGH